MPVRTATLTEPASPGRLRRRLRPERHRLRHLLVAALGALAVSAAFPPFGWWWSAPLGVALIVASAHEASVRLSAVAGAVAGAVFAGTSLAWLTSVGPDAYFAVTAVFAAWWAAMLTGIRLTMGLRAWPLLVPAVWVGQEWARSQWPLGGFPWARLAYVSVDSPFAALVPHLGVYGLTYVIAAIGSLLAAAIVGSHRRGALIAAGLAAAAVVASGAAVAQAAPAGSAQPAVQVAVVQGGGQPGAGEQQARAVLSAHVRQTRLLAADTVTPPAFVLWPESATDIDPLVDTQARAQINAAVADIGVPVVVGAVTAAPDQPQLARNQSISWMPLTGPGVAYTKRQLVPFGEYVPARGLLERLTSRFTQVPRDFVSGTDSPVIDVGAVRLGMLICYEVAFDDRVTDAVSAGATVLAVPSNNATYAGTTQPAQQLVITRFRALETARATLLASTTGVSAIIDSSGSVLTSIEDGAAGSRIGDVAPSTQITTAVRWGGGIGVALTVIAVVAVLIGAFAHKRAARRSHAGLAPTTWMQ